MQRHRHRGAAAHPPARPPGAEHHRLQPPPPPSPSTKARMLPPSLPTRSARTTRRAAGSASAPRCPGRTAPAGPMLRQFRRAARHRHLPSTARSAADGRPGPPPAARPGSVERRPAGPARRKPGRHGVAAAGHSRPAWRAAITAAPRSMPATERPEPLRHAVGQRGDAGRTVVPLLEPAGDDAHHAGMPVIARQPAARARRATCASAGRIAASSIAASTFWRCRFTASSVGGQGARLHRVVATAAGADRDRPR